MRSKRGRSFKKGRSVKFAAANYDEQWEFVVSQEKTRRELLLRVEEPMRYILMSWKGTIISMIFKDVLFWLTLCVYVGMRVFINYALFATESTSIDYLDNFNTKSIAIVGTFLSIMMVFFVQQVGRRHEFPQWTRNRTNSSLQWKR